MTLEEYYKDSESKSNKIYTIHYRKIEKDEIYVLNVFIQPKYRKRGYLRRIFNTLCKETNSFLVFECYSDLVDLYKKIGAFTLKESINIGELVEMYYDPLNLM